MNYKRWLQKRFSELQKQAQVFACTWKLYVKKLLHRWFKLGPALHTSYTTAVQYYINTSIYQYNWSNIVIQYRILLYQYWTYMVLHICYNVCVKLKWQMGVNTTNHFLAVRAKWGSTITERVNMFFARYAVKDSSIVFNMLKTVSRWVCGDRAIYQWTWQCLWRDSRTIQKDKY